MNELEFRLEHDSLGEVRVPAARAWGAQTERSFENFKIGTEKMPREILRAFLRIKAAAAETNAELGVLDEEVAAAIMRACRRIEDEECWDEFPLVVWQTGSGTQTNMNVNEVLAHVVNGEGQVRPVHPNDDINKSQSSNDTFPTALHVAALSTIRRDLLPKVKAMEETLLRLAQEYQDVVKIGRTHLQDAVPLTLGQEMSGWASMLTHDLEHLEQTSHALGELALGGTAVGTGLNAPKGFGARVAEILSETTGIPFRTAPNKFHALTSRSAAVLVHGALSALAADLMKIANDVRWLASGPRAGLGELIIPANEPGSSIMPGKVNPTQAEALTMVAVQVMGNQTAIQVAASQGNFELNVYLPLIAYNFLQSVRLLGDAMESFRLRCLHGLKPNLPVIRANVERSLMLVTALSPNIGYEKAAAIAHEAFERGLTLREVVLEQELLPEDELEKLLDPRRMV